MYQQVFRGFLGGFALFSATSSAVFSMDAIGTKTEVQAVGADVLARQMAGKPFYSFEVLPSGELRDADGSLIPFHSLLDHLRATKPDKNGFFEFRLSGVQLMNLANVAMDIFRQYGAETFSVKVPPGSPPPFSSNRVVPVAATDPNERVAPKQDTAPKASSPDSPPAEEGRKEYTVSPESAGKLLAGKQTYNFAVISANEFVDQEGRHFSPHSIKEYLAKVKPEKNAAYIFWVRDRSAGEIVKAALPAFDEYGAAIVFVREMEKPGTSRPQPDNDKTPKKTMLVGAPNPQAKSANDPLPDMLGRPAELRPGSLPRRVRYQFKSDAEVTKAARLVTATFLDKDSALEPSALRKNVFVQMGLWPSVVALPELKGVKPLHGTVELHHGLVTLDLSLLGEAGQTAAVAQAVRSRIAADGGGVLRALRTEEMNHWWTFIAFDIEEPIFVIETKGGHHRFVVGCSEDQISLIDDLNGLPSE